MDLGFGQCTPGKTPSRGNVCENPGTVIGNVRMSGSRTQQDFTQSRFDTRAILSSNLNEQICRSPDATLECDQTVNPAQGQPAERPHIQDDGAVNGTANATPRCEQQPSPTCWRPTAL